MTAPIYAPAVRRSIEDIRREHERRWLGADQHWQDIGVLLDAIADLESEIAEMEDLADAEHAYAAMAEAEADDAPRGGRSAP